MADETILVERRAQVEQQLAAARQQEAEIEAALREDLPALARAQELAEGWDRPAGAPDPDDVDDPIPDDRTVDHTGEEYVDDRADELVDD